MSDRIQTAVEIYIRREEAAMRTPQGADHKAILRQVASESGIETDVLTEAVITTTIAGAN